LVIRGSQHAQISVKLRSVSHTVVACVCVRAHRKCNLYISSHRRNWKC